MGRKVKIFMGNDEKNLENEITDFMLGNVVVSINYSTTSLVDNYGQLIVTHSALVLYN